MRYILLIFPLLLALTSCHPKIQESDTASVHGEDSVEARYLILARSLPDSLGRIGPYIMEKPDSGGLYSVSDSMDIGDSAILKMYKRDDDTWKIVGRHSVPFYVTTLEFPNADNDPSDHEVLLSGVVNVNGNRQRALYKYNSQTGILQYAGWFFTSDMDFDLGEGGYKIDKLHNTILVDYAGSIHGGSKSLFLWRNDSLVLLREVSWSLEGGTESYHQLEYYVNKDTTFSGGLTTVFSERDKANSHHHKKYWDRFFDLK
jgi:hypothetical protein